MIAIVFLVQAFAELDIPPLSDASWLPRTEVLLKMREQTVAHYLYFDKRRVSHPDIHFNWDAAATKEAADINAWYQDAVIATEYYRSVQDRREALRRLRDRSPYHYFSRELPPNVPYWRLPICKE